MICSGKSAPGRHPLARSPLAISSRGQRLIEAKVHLLLRAALRLVVLLEVPAGVVHDAVLGLEAEQLLGLVHRHKEGRVAEGEEALGNLHARLGVVRGHLHVGHPRGRAAQLGQVLVRDEVGGAAVEDLAHRLGVAQGGRDHRRVVGRVRQADELRAIARHQHRPAAACTVEERRKVALALLGSVDVLRPEAGEGQALLAQQLLCLPLPARLDCACLSDRAELTLGGRVHARAADVGVVRDAPRRRRVRVRRDVLRALGPVVDHRAE
mmetsp:Transcript_1618/g.3933  ORF Transcript_1618/g.3933 Transcript_1618/m.3933 type:complete len:267 (-) Transcript_1618:364-1164(-)